MLKVLLRNLPRIRSVDGEISADSRWCLPADKKPVIRSRCLKELRLKVFCPPSGSSRCFCDLLLSANTPSLERLSIDDFSFRILDVLYPSSLKHLRVETAMDDGAPVADMLAVLRTLPLLESLYVESVLGNGQATTTHRWSDGTPRTTTLPHLKSLHIDDRLPPVSQLLHYLSFPSTASLYLRLWAYELNDPIDEIPAYLATRLRGDGTSDHLPSMLVLFTYALKSPDNQCSLSCGGWASPYQSPIILDGFWLVLQIVEPDLNVTIHFPENLDRWEAYIENWGTQLDHTVELLEIGDRIPYFVNQHVFGDYLASREDEEAEDDGDVSD